MSHAAPERREFEALERLIRLAHNDTPAARCAASLLLSWSDAQAYGGFDLTQLWELNRDQQADALSLISYITRAGHGPVSLGLGDEIEAIAAVWRPQS